MWCKLDINDIGKMVNRQLGNYWDIAPPSAKTSKSLQIALERLEKNYSKVKSDYFWHGDEPAFRIEHTVQYSIFLYLFSNQLYKDGFEEEAAFVYYLNKIMHSVDWFYAIDLPDNFCAEHPLGSILGRARYGNYFFVYQGVTVGGSFDQDGKESYPELGEYVIMYSDSKVIGSSKIGNHVILSANAYVKDTDIPDYSIVFGQSPNLVIRTGEKSRERVRKLIGDTWKI